MRALERPEKATLHKRDLILAQKDMQCLATASDQMGHKVGGTALLSKRG